jgi:3-dehydroquinate synthase
VGSLASLGSSAGEYLVARCCALKAAVVAADETETTGRREILNYGHTFGHALEVLGGYTALNHGEAVAVGMGMAADLAVCLGLASAELVRRQDALLESLGLPRRSGLPGLTPERVLEAMFRDKKVRSGALRLVLPGAIGTGATVPCTDTALLLRVIGGRCGEP